MLNAGKAEFARLGFAGARVAAIAARGHANKQLICYYFGSKEDLYLEVLERAYCDIREAESGLKIEDLEPVEALRTVVEFTWNYYLENPEFLARSGFNGLLVDRESADSFAEVAGEISAAGGSSLGFIADVADLISARFERWAG